MKTILSILGFCCTFCTARAQIQVISATRGCAFYDTLTQNDLYGFEPEQEAERIVNEIVQALGLTRNFRVLSSNVPNALATTDHDVRYILYSTEFLEKFKQDAATRWAAYLVLAHEVGHHLNDHNLEETDFSKRRLMELEADQFAGSVLRVLGAPLQETLAGIDAFPFPEGTATHPSKSARRAAIANAWKKQDELLKANEKMLRSPEEIRRDSLAAEAKRWFERGQREDDFERKMAHFEKALAIDTAFFEAYLARGKALFEKGKFAGAKSDFEKTIQLEPQDAGLYVRLAETQAAMKDFQGAIFSFERAIQLDPQQVAASYFRIGEMNIQLEQFEAAESWFAKSIRTDSVQFYPKVVADMFSIGERCAESDRPELAVVYYSKCIAMDPKNWEAYVERGRVYVDMANYEKGFQDFNWVIKNTTGDDSGSAFFYRGVANYQVKKYQQALDDFGEARKHSMPGLANIYTGLAYYQLGNYERAVYEFDFMIAMYADEPEAASIYWYRHLAYDAWGKTPEAIKDLNEAIQLDSTQADYFNARGFLKNKLKQWPEAILDFDKAIKLEPDYAYAYNNRGEAKRQSGRPLEALQDIEKSLALDPKNAWAYANKGCALTQLGRYQEALEWLDKGLDIDPSFEWAKTCRAEALAKLKH